MKRLPVYMILIMLLFSCRKGERSWDERVTLKKDHTIPYGTEATKELLASLFDEVPVFFNKNEPMFWGSVNRWTGNQAVFMIADHFNADEEEVEVIMNFVRNGNHVFIIARNWSYDVVNRFGFNYSANTLDLVMGRTDSLKLVLEPSYFPDNAVYAYPGRSYSTVFTAVDTARTEILGRTEQGYPNFIRMRAGRGAIYLHSAPLAFSNYFVLHKNNHQYFSQAVSVVPADVESILWNEYYLSKPASNNEKETSWLGVLMKYPPFKWGLITAMLTLGLYVLLNMRRRQRYVPSYAKPKNDSLDFVRTIGRLYYQRRDHGNLARKMRTHFLDHVRSTYKLSTVMLDESFINRLHFKSGYPVDSIREIIANAEHVEQERSLSEVELIAFHQQLEKFYQNT